MKDLLKKIDWEKVDGLVPAIIQDALSGKVLMLGYMNQEALTKTLETSKVCFYSRTKKRLWLKGQTSGNFLNLAEIYLDCDSDTLLIKVDPQGPTCHKGSESCFKVSDSGVISKLFALIKHRKEKLPENSYTSSLFNAGLDQISAKIDEEAAEVIKAAKFETLQRLREESVDLLYHLFVLLNQKGLDLSEILQEIKKRMK